MSNKKSKEILIVFFLFSINFLQSCDNNDQSYNSSDSTVTNTTLIPIGPTLHNFGDVDIGKSIRVEFKVKNISLQTIKPKIKASYGCTEIKLSNSDIQPKEIVTLTAKIDTKDRAGQFRANIMVMTPNNEKVEYTIIGNVISIAEIICEPSIIKLGDIDRNHTIKLTIKANVITKNHQINWKLFVINPQSKDKHLISWNEMELSQKEKINRLHSTTINIFEGELTITTLSDGTIDENIELRAQEINGTHAAYHYIPVIGRVRGQIWSDQSEVFLGIVNASSSKEFSITIYTVGDSTPINIKRPDESIHLLATTKIEGKAGWKYDFAFTPSAQHEFYNNNIEFVSGNDSASVKIAAKITK